MEIMTESNVEEADLAWLEAFGWQIAHGPGIAPDNFVNSRPPSRRPRS